MEPTAVVDISDFKHSKAVDVPFEAPIDACMQTVRPSSRFM